MSRFHLMSLVIMLLFLLLPPVLVLFSGKVSGWQKMNWSLVALFLSWVGFAVFLLAGSRADTGASRMK